MFLKGVYEVVPCPIVHRIGIEGSIGAVSGPFACCGSGFEVGQGGGNFSSFVGKSCAIQIIVVLEQG